VGVGADVPRVDVRLDAHGAQLQRPHAEAHERVVRQLPQRSPLGLSARQRRCLEPVARGHHLRGHASIGVDGRAAVLRAESGEGAGATERGPRRARVDAPAKGGPAADERAGALRCSTLSRGATGEPGGVLSKSSVALRRSWQRPAASGRETIAATQ